jgi:hypothetical protein
VRSPTPAGVADAAPCLHGVLVDFRRLPRGAQIKVVNRD